MDLNRIGAAFIGALVCVSAAAGPYAPAGSSVAAFVSIPDESDVGIPAYPGARIYATIGPQGPEAENSTLILYTADPKDKVLEFYKENLKDWTVGQIEETGDPLVHEGKDTLDPFAEQGLSTRYVQLGDGIEPMGKTRITIGYHKVEQQAVQAPNEPEEGQAGGEEEQ